MERRATRFVALTWLRSAPVVALAVALLGVIVMGSGGCDAIVGATLHAFTCTGSDPSSCPAGQFCQDGACVPCVGDPCGVVEADAGPPEADVVEAAVVDRSPPPTDAPADVPNVVDAGCNGALGCTCSVNADCRSGVCGDKFDETNALFTAHGNYCVKPCCASSDCDSGFVCFAPGTGGNYCVRGAWLGRATDGASGGGAVCSANTDCRSGICAANKRCADTCCDDGTTGATACASGSTCTLGAFPGMPPIDQHWTFSCKTGAGPLSAGSVCTADADCKSGGCYASCSVCFAHCRKACRNSTQCSGSDVCADLDLSGVEGANDIATMCFPSTTGTTPLGGTCTTDGNCVTGFCNASVCTDKCFGDSDCAVASMTCKPAFIQIGPTSIEPLACTK